MTTTTTEVEGELWIGGDGVSRGYLHADELTVKKFIPDPFLGRSSSGVDGRSSSDVPMMYCTGDIVKRIVNHSTNEENYVFVRRIDDQVKINGYRYIYLI